MCEFKKKPAPGDHELNLKLCRLNVTKPDRINVTSNLAKQFLDKKKRKLSTYNNRTYYTQHHSSEKLFIAIAFILNDW